jgi:hypothetical protein
VKPKTKQWLFNIGFYGFLFCFLFRFDPVSYVLDNWMGPDVRDWWEAKYPCMAMDEYSSHGLAGYWEGEEPGEE